MRSYVLSHVTDEELLADLTALVASDRQTTAALLAHLAEVDARELFLPAACPSMHVYCVRVLRLAEEVAYKRIRAARAARRYPQIFDAIADGRLHVTGVVVLAPHLTDANVDEVLAQAAYRSKAELEMLVVRLAPKPDVPAFIAPLDPQTTAPVVVQLDPDPVRAPTAQPTARVQALAPERFALQCTISGETRDKLERLQALMRHRNPSGDLAEVIDRACDALIEVIEREKFAATSRPRPKKGARPESEDPTYIPADVKRAVHERDGEQCTFTSETGVRCTERGYLEFDHVVPAAHRGKPTIANVRLLCGAHNQYEAERKLGAAFMVAKRAQAKASAAKDRERQMTKHDTTMDNAGAGPLDAELVDNAVAKPTVPPTRQRELVDEAVVKPAGSPTLEREIVEALTSLGYKSAEARCAVSNTAAAAEPTFEGRLRAALAYLSRSRPIRCSEEAFDRFAGLPLWLALRDWR